MNKWRHITALLGTAAVLLAACGGSKTEEAGQQASGESSGELTVAIWDTYQEPGLKEMMAGFTEETGISVKIQVTPWDQYWTMMEAGATGGTMPDVFWMHSNQVAKYAEYDLLLDLSDYIGTSEVTQMDKFPQELVELYQNKDGKPAFPTRMRHGHGTISGKRQRH